MARTTETDRPINERLTLKEVASSIGLVGRESSLLFIAFLFANLSNYVFHAVMTRLLGPHGYGALGSVLAIVTIVAVPTGALQAAVTRRISVMRLSRSDEEVAKAWSSIFWSSIPLAFAAVGVFAALSPLIVHFLHLDSILIALLIAFDLFPIFLHPVVGGALQGWKRFNALAVLVASRVVIRLLFGVVAVEAGAGVAGAVAASIAADLIALCFGVLLVRQRHRIHREGKRVLRPILSEALPIASAVAALWALIELDLVLARHYLVPGAAGRYAAAGLLARAALFMPTAVGAVALPRFSETSGRGPTALRWLVVFVSLVLVLGCLAAGGLTIVKASALKITFGASYASGAGVLPPLAFAMVGYGLINLLLLFHVGATSTRMHFLWIGVAFEAAGIYLFHGSGPAIAWVTLVTSVLCLAVSGASAAQLALQPSGEPSLLSSEGAVGRGSV